MEYANGGDLHAYVQRKGRLSEKEARSELAAETYFGSVKCLCLKQRIASMMLTEYPDPERVTPVFLP